MIKLSAAFNFLPKDAKRDEFFFLLWWLCFTKAANELSRVLVVWGQGHQKLREFMFDLSSNPTRELLLELSLADVQTSNHWWAVCELCFCTKRCWKNVISLVHLINYCFDGPYNCKLQIKEELSKLTSCILFQPSEPGIKLNNWHMLLGHLPVPCFMSLREYTKIIWRKVKSIGWTSSLLFHLEKLYTRLYVSPSPLLFMCVIKLALPVGEAQKSINATQPPHNTLYKKR